LEGQLVLVLLLQPIKNAGIHDNVLFGGKLFDSSVGR